MSNIVLLSMSFFGYEETIKLKIEEMGHKCQLINSEPRFNTVDSLMKKIDKNRLIKRTFDYISKVVLDIEACDELIIIFSPNLSRAALDIFRKRFPHIKIIYYIWDSVYNFPNVLNIAKGCDRVFSFDKNDCKKYGFDFLPLFYSDNAVNDCKKKYDYSMVFSIYPKKVRNYEKLIDAIPPLKSGYRHIYVAKKMYFYYKLFFPEFRTVKYDDVKFYILNKKDVYDIFKRSKVTIDCPLESQSGLTMRTFEALSSGIKLVTTNTDIVNYDFYSPNNIFVVDENNKMIPDDFFSGEFKYEESNMDNYSLEAFVCNLLSDRKDTHNEKEGQ